MGLAWLASRALRSSSSRVLSYRTIFSTPDLCKPVALGARFHFPNSDPKSCSVHIARFYYHDQLSISVNWRKQRSVASSLVALLPALFLGLSLTPVLAEDASTELTETDSSGSDFTGLRKIDDGSVVSNIHTSKWRVFTDNGRDLFLQGKLEDAERLFVGALQEAKEGFGERDPHVASACNNLAELYRVKKAFDKAEPLYLEAINILEESYGHEDVRVGAALHNLGQFYLLQKKLDAAHACYKVLYLQGNVKDAEALITESIQIFEDGGQGESFLFLRRLRYLVQIYINCNKLTDAVNIQRKILHIMEVSKGRDSLETVIAAESLALTLQSVGSLMEAKELLERCLNSRKRLLPEDHIQIAANLLHMARVELLLYSQTSKDIAVIEKAKDLLGNSIRVARQALDKLVKQGANRKSNDTYSEHTALLILLQALNVLTQVEVSKAELNKEKSMVLAEKALLDCISAFKQYGSQKAVDDLKGEYLSCLKHLSGILLLRSSNSNNPTRPTLQELENEIKRVEAP
ncbi:uncharacterized protein LOC112516029 isoform X2 [Cynara cardunculus var. scolymus]|uniref:uncharacterized protein LOC112516029 isoform X2 n=1 Tax=Cynara cardunculus var. scolymus TaxID=59895 RepID=UPI000D62A691|nr:uncharacterized protein LOC112516029 isoform X2 [Cynara cardunculus var. scolymus]